jgi:D-lactate dehydrogenase (cytochrome)
MRAFLASARRCAPAAAVALAFAPAASAAAPLHAATPATVPSTRPAAPADAPFSVPVASPRARTPAAVAAVLVAALESTGEEPAAASAAAVSSGAAVAHLGAAAWSYHAGPPPAAAVSPRSTAQVSAILRACAAHRLAVIARAGGTSLEGQTVPRGVANADGSGIDGIDGVDSHVDAADSAAPLVVVLDMSRLARVLSVSAADLTADVEPGVGWEALGAALAPRGLLFPVDPGPGALVGGMAGTNCSGTHACRYGAFKANVLAVEAVAADGTVFRAGSRARKSSAGLDLTSLLVGAEGTLGVITRLTLRLVPAPPVTRVLATPFPSSRAACAAVADAVARGVALAAAELMDADMCGAVAARDGALLPDGAVATVLWKLAGSAAAVDADATAVRALAAAHGAARVREADGPAAAALWEARKTALFSAGATRGGDGGDVRVLTTDVCVPLSALPALLERFAAHEAATRGDSRVRVFAVAHAADGNAHHFVVFDRAAPAEAARAADLSAWLARAAIALGGTCTGEHGVGEGKLGFVREELGEGYGRVARAVKCALDPHATMNPGRKIPAA